MSQRQLVYGFALLIGLLTWGGCGGGGDNQQRQTGCQTADDCNDGETCRSGLCLNTCESASDCQASGSGGDEGSSGTSKTCRLGGVCVVECETNGDCPGDQRCHSTGTCWPKQIDPEICEQDTDCSSSEYCGSGVCLQSQCEGDADCQGLNICQNGTCRTGCRTESNRDDDRLACPSGFQCNETTNTCNRVGCTMGSCGDFQECDDSTSPPECTYTGNCGGQNGDAVCNAFANQEGESVPYICDEGQGTCVKKPSCKTDTDCGAGEICKKNDGERNQCQDGCRCTDGCDRECPAGEICSSNNRCVVGCQSNSECTRKNPGDNWYCIERVTTEEPVCVRGCTTADDCETEGLTCRSTQNGPKACRPCTKNSQCTSEELCKTDLGATEEQKNNPDVGLCDDKPPPCPDDMFGSNHTQRSAFSIQSFPFEEKPLFCRNKTKGEWFRLQVQENKVVDISLEYDESAGNLDVALRSGQGDEIVASAVPPTQDEGDERIVYGANTSRRFFIHVRGSITSENIEYDLDVDVRDPKSCNQDEFEENDSRSEATKLPADTTHENLEVCADLESEADPDFYKLEVGRDKLVEISAEAPPTLGDINLFLFDSNGDPVARARSDQNVETLTYSNQQAQTLTLEVRIATGVGRVQYDLRWNQTDNVCADSQEPNDSCPATVSTLDRSQLTGQSGRTLKDMTVCNDDDFYAVELLPRDTLKATATYNPIQAEGQLQFTLYGPNACQRVIGSATEESVSNSNAKRLTFDHQTDKGGTFYLGFQKYVGVENVPYELEVAVEAGRQCQDDGNEPNDNRSEATPIKRSEVLDGGRDAAFVKQRICDRNEDWYCADLQNGDNVEWDVQFDHGGGNINAFVVGPNGTTLKSGTSADNNESLAHTASQAGEFCLKVSGATPVRNNYNVLTRINGKGTADQQCPDVYEQNDKRSNRVALSPGTYQQLSVCGGFPSDNDWYETKVGPGEKITVTARYSGSSGNVGLDLFEGNGQNTVDQDGFSKPVEVTDTNDASAQQTYVYQVRSNTASALSVYDLEVQTQQVTQCSDDADEPNDTPMEATSIEAPGVYSGRYKCESNEDWYEIAIQQDETGEKIRAFLNHDASKADLDLEWYRLNGGQPSKIKDSTSTSDDETLTATPSQAGSYFVKVVSKKPARLPYDLVMYRDLDGDGDFDDTPREGSGDQSCPDQFESNDSRGEATALQAGQKAEQLLTCADTNDEDWYETTVAPGDEITVTAQQTSGAGDVKVVLEDENGTVRDQSNFAKSVTVEHTSNREQTYYYRVEPDTSGRAFYDIDVQVQSSTSCTDDGREPNDGAGEATTVEAPGLVTRLQKCESNDDWFQIDVSPSQTGEKVQAFLNHDAARGDLDLALYEQTGSNPIEINQLKTSTSTSDDETLEFTPQSSGNYYVEVVSKRPARVTYDLLFYRDLDGNGQFDTPEEGVGDKTCPDQFENNDQAGEARQIAARSYDDLSMCTDSNGQADADFYEIYVPGSASLTIDAKFTHADGNIDMEVYRGSVGGQPLTSSTTTSDNESVTVDPQQGARHFIKVYGTANGAFRNAYELDLSISFSSACSEDQFNNNHSMANAAKISSKDFDMSNGLTLCENTEDWFQIEQPSRGSALFALEHRSSLGAIDMTLMDASGKNVIARSTSRFGGNLRLIDFRKKNLDAGTYFLKIEPDGRSIVRNDYDLWASFGGKTPSQPFCPDPYERNDAPGVENAAPVSVGDGIQMTDERMCGAEEDWFRMDLQKSRTYHFGTYFEHGSSSDLAIELQDEQGNVVKDVGGQKISFGNDTSSDDETASFSPQSNGTYLFGIDRSTGSSNMTPLVDVQTDSSCPEDQYDKGGDSNQSKANAAKLPSGSGTYALGSCGGSDQRTDWFQVKAQSAGKFEVRVYHNDDAMQASSVASVVRHVRTGVAPPFDSSDNRLTWNSEKKLVVAGNKIEVKKGDTFLIKVTTPSNGQGAYFLEIID